MAPQLGALATLPENPSSVFNTHTLTHNCLQCPSQASHTLFWPPRTPGAHEVHRRTCDQNVHVQNIIKRKMLKNIIKMIYCFLLDPYKLKKKPIHKKVFSWKSSSLVTGTLCSRHRTLEMLNSWLAIRQVSRKGHVSPVELQSHIQVLKA